MIMLVTQKFYDNWLIPQYKRVPALARPKTLRELIGMSIMQDDEYCRRYNCECIVVDNYPNTTQNPPIEKL